VRARAILLAICAAALTVPALAQTQQEAIQALRDYYAAINAKNYAAAFALWEKADDGTNAKGQTLAKFSSGFAGTASVEIEIGQAGDIEGAAGSSFVEVPVTISATDTSQQTVKFAGTYTLRASSLAEGRRWRIYTATIRKSRAD
jgi:hypothetical protein